MEKCDHCGGDMVETLKAEVILDSPNGDEVYVDVHATEKGVFIRVQSDENISHDVPSRNYERWERRHRWQNSAPTRLAAWRKR